MGVEPKKLSFSDLARETLLERFSEGCPLIGIDNPYHDYKRAAIWAGSIVYDAINNPGNAELLAFIKEQRLSRSEQVFVIENCPIDDDLLPVPYESQTKDYADNASDRGKEGFVCEYILLGLNWLLRNKPVQHPREHAGHVIHHIAPRKATANTASSMGSIKFGHHRENPHDNSELSIDWFSLLALRNHATPTSFATREEIADILDRTFTPRERELMASVEGGGRFRFTSGVSEVGETTSLISPVEEFHADRRFKGYRIQTEANRVFVAYPEAEDAVEVEAIIAKLKEAFLDIGSKVVLKPGHMLVLNNTCCTHGREELHPLDRDEGNLMDMRHLTRVWNRELPAEWDLKQVCDWLGSSR